MVGNDRLNVPAIDTYSHSFGGSCTEICIPFLVGVLHYRMYSHMYRCIW